MSSPGPTLTMKARQIRMGDVMHVDDEPHAVTAVEWEGGNVLVSLDGFDEGVTGPWVFALDDLVDVTRPFARHAEAGEHDR